MCGLRPVLKTAFQDSVPVFFGYVPLGIVFGLLLVGHGHPWVLAPLMSTFAYAGTTQLVAIGMIDRNASLLALFSAIAIIDLRHIFYSLSVAERFPVRWRRKWYLTHGLTDETYSILTSRPPLPENDAEYCLFLTLLNHLYWIGGTTLGALFGTLVKVEIPALRFVLTALFLVLTLEQWQASRSRYPFLAALLAGGLALAMCRKQLLLLSLLIATILLLMEREEPCAT